MLTNDDKGGYHLKPYLRSVNIQKEQVDTSDVKSMWLSSAELETYRLKNADLLVSEGGDVGRTCIWNEELSECYIQNSVNRVRFHSGCPRFYLYHFQAHHSSMYFDSIVNRVSIPHLTKEKLQEVLFVEPPLEEQQIIANYLDGKTSLIDETIRKKQHLIELLQEEQTALINQAVTRGLNPDVKTKPSRVEWLGAVPAHWKVKKIKHLVNKIGSGVTPKGGAEVYQTSGIPLLRSQNIYFDGLRLDDVAYITQDVHEIMSNSWVQVGDVLLNITGASIGRCFYVESSLGIANVNQHVCILRPSEVTCTKYLYYFLASWIGQTQIDRLQNGANREGLNYEQLKNFFVPLPGKVEQEAITLFLDRETSKFETIKKKIEQEISLLQEYRTALINEVVTGKRCVVPVDEEVLV